MSDFSLERFTSRNNKVGGFVSVQNKRISYYGAHVNTVDITLIEAAKKIKKIGGCNLKVTYSYDEVNIDDLTTATKVTECFRRMGKNIIPIIPGTKIPTKGFDLKSYFDKK